MKLLYAAIENFGTLHNLHVDFEEGINCIYESNGWGKLKSGMGWISLDYTKKC